MSNSRSGDRRAEASVLRAQGKTLLAIGIALGVSKERNGRSV